MGKPHLREIKTCTSCEFYCKSYNRVEARYQMMHFCRHPRAVDYGFGKGPDQRRSGYSDTIETFLLRSSTPRSIGNIKIPTNCPLPDYQEGTKRGVYGM